MVLSPRNFRGIEEAVLSCRLVPPGSGVVVGCSGGADSLALLSVLWDLRTRLDLRIVAAHANHQLRGDESDGDEAHVRKFCAEKGIEFELACLDLSGSGEPGNLEDRARIARYDFLAQTAVRRRSIVATGHTLDDQAETFLMKLIRGAGPGGLSGIAEERYHPDPASGEPVRVVRPLLAVSRGRIVDYLQDKGLAFRVDRSNLDPSFDRNWVRRELMPLLEERLNPQAKRALVRAAGLMGEIEHFLEAEAQQFLSSACLSSEGGTLPLDRLLNLALPLQKVAIRLAVAAVRGSLTDLVQGHVDSILDLAHGSSGRRVSLPGGFVAVREFNDLRLGPDRVIGAFCAEMDVPADVVFPTLAKRVRIEAAGDTAGALWLPCRRVRIRSRLPGDRFQTSPAAPSKKLKKLFQERRVPISDRGRLLVLECEAQIVWVEGFPYPPRGSSEGAEGGWFRISIETFRNEEPSNR
jgi:tRNA(Ile)-lysidine synthase